MRHSVQFALILVCIAILGAGPTTRPVFDLTDKQIVAGYEVQFKANQTREGVPRRNGLIKGGDGSRVSIAILGEEGHPSQIILPDMTLAKNALQGNEGTLKIAQTVFSNIVDFTDEPGEFRRLIRDLQDLLKLRRESLDRDYGDVHLELEITQNTAAYIDVTFTFKRKPG